MTETKPIDAVVHQYNQIFNEIPLQRLDSFNLKPLGPLSDMVANGPLIGFNSPLNFATRVESLTAEVNPQVDSLEGEDLKIAHLDMTILEGICNGFKVHPPLNLMKFIDDLSIKTNKPPTIPYDLLIKGVRVITKNTEGKVAKSEARFYQGHALIEQELEIANQLISSMRLNINSEGIETVMSILDNVNTLVLAITFGIPKEDFAVFRSTLGSSLVRGLPKSCPTYAELSPKQLISQNHIDFVAELAKLGIPTASGPSGAFSHGIALFTLSTVGGNDDYKNYILNQLQYFSPEFRLQLKNFACGKNKSLADINKTVEDVSISESLNEISEMLQTIRLNHKKGVAYQFGRTAPNIIGTAGKPALKFLTEMRKSTKYE